MQTHITETYQPTSIMRWDRCIIILFYFIYIILYFIILYYNMLYYIVLYFIMVYYCLLYYIILFCITLFCIYIYICVCVCYGSTGAFKYVWSKSFLIRWEWWCRWFSRLKARDGAVDHPSLWSSALVINLPENIHGFSAESSKLPYYNRKIIKEVPVWLVVWNILYLSIQLEIPWSQLTFTLIIFQRGRA